MHDPLVSIVIPAYNAEKYIAAAVQSALDQTWDNKEIIVINNGSTDDTQSVLERFNSRLITIISQNNIGASAARNAGLKAAKGDYIQFLDADDLLSPDKIEGQVRALNHSTSQVGICKTVQFQDGDDYLKSPADNNWYYKDHNDVVDFLLKLYAGEDILPGYGGIVQPNTWLTPMAVIKKAGFWNEDLSTDDDGEFFCRVILAAQGIKFSADGLNYYRKHKAHQSLSGGKSTASFESRLLAIDLKYSYLKNRAAGTLTDKIFARLYWWLGVEAYPEYKSLSKQSIDKATSLGYQGEKYVGGANGHIITKFLGWKIARLISHYRHNK